MDHLGSKATLRGLKRCPNTGCEEYMGMRAKACKRCRINEILDNTSSSTNVSSARQKRQVVELQNCCGNTSQRIFAVADEVDSKVVYGIVVLEQDVFNGAEVPMFKVFCYLSSCMAKRSAQNGPVTCQHGPSCAQGKPAQSKCLALHWEYIFSKIPSIPESIIINLTTAKKLSTGFNFSAQPVQKIDRSTYAVFGPKSTTEPHGVSFVSFNLFKKEYYCSCESFLESGTTSCYDDICGQIRVCYHVYLLLAAFLSDFNCRERIKVTAKFCHLFLQDVVEAEARGDATEVWSQEQEEENKQLKEIHCEPSFETETSEELIIGKNVLASIPISPDLYICNLIHLMREAMQPLTASKIGQALIETHIPTSIFLALERRIIGKFGNEWKPIAPTVTVSGYKGGKKKHWEILGSRTFNHFMTLTDDHLREKYGPKLSLERFFMMDAKDGAIEVSKMKIERMMQGCFDDESEAELPSDSPLNNENQAWENGNESADASGKVKFQKLKPSFFSSQVVVGRHPITTQHVPCLIEWKESSPDFGTLTITFSYAKKVNGCFV